jgi:hypothetical protein
MYFIKEMLGQYRIHSGNQSSSVIRQLNADLRVFNEFLPKENLHTLKSYVRVRRRYCLAYYGAGRAMQRNGKFDNSWTMLFRGVAYWPFFMKSYIAIIFGLIGTARQWRKQMLKPE